MQQSLAGTRLAQQRPSSARPVGRRGVVSTVAMAKRKVNTFDEAWKKVRSQPGFRVAGSERLVCQSGRMSSAHNGRVCVSRQQQHVHADWWAAGLPCRAASDHSAAS